MALAFAASTALVALGGWLYERRGQTQAALATVAAGLAALYASDAATTLHYHLLSPSLGLVIAGAVGAVALATAVRWSSQEIAGIGIVGSLLAPVFVDAGPHTSSLVFMTIALLAAIGVVLWRRWTWLAAAAYVVSVPQAASWLWNEHDGRLGLTLAVAAAFWLLYVVAAIGHELRSPTQDLRLSSASLLFVNATVAAAGGWWLIDDAGHRAGANAWLFGLAVAHVALGTLVLRSRVSREIALLLYGVAAAMLGVAITVSLDGPAVVAAWAAEAMVLAWAGRWTKTPGAASPLGSCSPPSRAGTSRVRGSADGAGLGLPLDPVGSRRKHARPPGAGGNRDCRSRGRRPQGHRGLGRRRARRLPGERARRRPRGRPRARVDSDVPARALGLLERLGFAAIVAGLIRDKRVLRLGGLGVLTLAVGKVFLVDLAHLQSIWRVGSFLAIGLLLLAGAFAYQRVRVPSLHERRAAG
jgi:Predicted membrane protein